MKSLFVPIGLEIFMTGKENRADKAPMLAAPDYPKLKTTFLGDRIERPTFNSGIVLPSGIHLHFILPDALTHAEEMNQDFVYPSIPDRWIVARLEAKEQLKVTCWIVENSYIGSENKDSISIPDFQDPVNYHKYLGRSYICDQVPSSQSLGDDTFRLTAVGPGDLAFAAYYPNCKSVLGFHDPLPECEEGEFTYLAVGYYNNLSCDPVHGLNEEAVARLINKYKWHVEDENFLAERTVCHGMAYGVKWEGHEKEYPSGAPAGTVEAAIGNTSMEALAALITHKISPESDVENLERFLNVLQNDLMSVMESMDGIPEVEDMIHKEGFAPEYGGKAWRLQQNEKMPEEKGHSLPQKTGLLLSKLNLKQKEIDDVKRTISWTQDAVFACWQLYETRVEVPPRKTPVPSQEEVAQEIKNLLLKCRVLEKDELRYTKELDELKEQITDCLEQTEGEYTLKEITEEDFYCPNEPVLLLAGGGINRPYAFGQDGRFRNDGKLDCRISSVSGLSGDHKNLSEKDILDLFEKVPKLPLDCFSGLLCEAVCLSPMLLSWVKDKTGISNPKPDGLLPSPIGCRQWSQSWVTLYLEWKVDYFPTKTENAVSDDSMNGWNLGEIDYHFEGDIPIAPSQKDGRTILTPLSTHLLKNALQKYLESHMDEKLKKLLDKIENLQVVSQRMSGFNTQLLSKRQPVQLPLLTKSKKDEDKALASEVERCLQNRNQVRGMPSWRFLPIRSGFLQLTRVDVCSSFGQRQTLLSELNETVFSEQLPAYNKKLGSIPPRLVQGGRVLFDFVSSQDKQLLSGLPQETSPICGYLVPDILNMNLLVFDDQGVWLGMFRAIYENGKPLGVYMDAPGKTKTDILNQYLKDFVESLEQYKVNQDPAFGALMKLIDQRLGNTDNKMMGDSLASIWGRPLALVRARASMQLMGPPAYSMDLKCFGQYKTDEFEKISYPLLVGDIARIQDGVIGYFCDADSSLGYAGFRKLYCAVHAQDVGISTKYLEFREKAAVSSDDKKPVYMTLLVEPASRISIRSGILPASYSRLMAEHYQPVMNKLYLAMETAPILTEVPNNKDIYIPVSKESEGSWSWNHLETQGSFTERPSILNPEAVFHEENPYLIDGYLIRRSKSGKE